MTGTYRVAVKIGGVPEHFNYPFQLAEELGLFKKNGVQVEFVIQREGTGQMIKVRDRIVDGITLEALSTPYDRPPALSRRISKPVMWT